MKIPKTLGGQIDFLYKLREKRLAIEREANSLKANEKVLHSTILLLLREQRAEKASGKLGTVTRSVKTIGKVTDWDAFYTYISKNKAFELLQRRVNHTSFNDRYDAGERVAGVEPETVVDLSLHKAGA